MVCSPTDFLILYGRSKKQFTRLLRSLQQDLEPVGTLEEVLVEKIAHEYWRVGVAAFHEAQDLSEASPFKRTSIDRLVRYQTTINRQLFQAMNQLESCSGSERDTMSQRRWPSRRRTIKRRLRHQQAQMMTAIPWSSL